MSTLSTADFFDLDVVSTSGPVRSENQDAALVWRGTCEEVFVVVSDGVGGHARGRQAAEKAVRTCAEVLQNHNGNSWEKVLEVALMNAHEEVRGVTGGDWMAATAVVACIDGGSEAPVLNLAHVGDSRAYLCRGRSIYRLTSDHSVVSQLVRDGFLTESQAFGHPDNNIIQRALGQAKPLEPEVHPTLRLEAADVLMLCTDGLHGVVPDEEIRIVIQGSMSAKETCRNLVDAALEAKSQDNISVACVRLRGSQVKPRPTRPSA